MNDLSTLPRFDWYQATVETDPHSLLAALTTGFSGDLQETRGRHGYTQGFDIVADGSRVATVLTGGKNGYPNATGSGQFSEAFARIIRGNFPNAHRVTRMDSAVDFDDGPDTFDRLKSIALALADDRALTVNFAGDWHRNEAGRTLYIGSATSAVRVRIYEKGIKEGDEYSRNWVRVEVQVRPQRDARRTAATSTPFEAWGFSAWTSDLALSLLSSEVQRVSMSVRRITDDARSLEAMTSQYWRVLERLAASEGSWAGAGDALGRLVANIGTFHREER